MTTLYGSIALHPAPPQRGRQWLLGLAAAASLLASAAAVAQPDPAMSQVYRAAQSGQPDRAQQLLLSVLKEHPDSGKAHYVEAELLAAQGRLGSARGELASAERLAPGLPFAHADAVQNLRAQLQATWTGTAPGASAAPGGAGLARVDHARRWPAVVPLEVLLAGLGGALLAWLLMRLLRPVSASTPSDDVGSAAAPVPLSPASPSNPPKLPGPARGTRPERFEPTWDRRGADRSTEDDPKAVWPDPGHTGHAVDRVTGGRRAVMTDGARWR